MDFTFTQDQDALRELARQILTDLCTHERQKALAAAGQWFDEVAWRELAKAKLLGVAIPEAFGGSGLGLTELFILIEEAGAAVAPVPLLPSLVLGALPLSAHGSAEQQERWLAGVASGDVVLTAALTELDAADPSRPTATARRDGSTWRLDGVKSCVPAAEIAQRILVPARTGDGKVGLFWLDPAQPGVTIDRQIMTHAEPHGRIALSGASVAAADVLGDPHGGDQILAWLLQRATLAYCALQVGVCERALKMTAEYTIGRQQFDRSIASFQAVHQRAADAYIDIEAIRLTTWEAIYRLSEGLPVGEEILIAKFWAAEGGHRASVAAQHLHGGIGVDIDYPLHRYFLWAKHCELALGPGTQQLAKLGAAMAASMR